MWTTLLIRGDQIQDVAVLDGCSFHMGVVSAATRSLLVQVETREDAQHHAAYTAMLCNAVRWAHAPTHGTFDPNPVDDLAPHEQQILHAWLVARSWRSWARAAIAVRAMVGAADPAIPLAAAARHTSIALVTLTNAAARDRLPTIQVADRHLVYLATISEALARGHLHHRPGRPARGRG